MLESGSKAFEIEWHGDNFEETERSITGCFFFQYRLGELVIYEKLF